MNRQAAQDWLDAGTGMSEREYNRLVDRFIAGDKSVRKAVEREARSR